ncbi:hypothetical protein GAS19_02835 [Burkholderia glumae]|uniref:hypothetical protein n=1 Tax=Burkholderia glumae TaxID=337 RepID=UPI00129641FB|nr:hypothetical protein [Burkholderia glumae]QGA36715.1 hypothetical protein GAS19_02835 [Burkholderia glumae]
MESTKLASEQVRVARGRTYAKTTYTLTYAFCMTIPALNFFFGMLFLVLMAFNIYRLSAQRKTDFFWLFVGSVVSIVGFVIGLAMLEAIPPIGGWIGAMITFGLNLFVAIFILGGRLGHILFGAPAKR